MAAQFAAGAFRSFASKSKVAGAFDACAVDFYVGDLNERSLRFGIHFPNSVQFGSLQSRHAEVINVIECKGTILERPLKF